MVQLDRSIKLLLSLNKISRGSIICIHDTSIYRPPDGVPPNRTFLSQFSEVSNSSVLLSK
jgi:hypothetical protein